MCSGTATRRWMLVLLVLCCMLTSALCEAIAGGQKEWVCKAEGTYVRCDNSRSWVPCQEFRSRGMGIAKDRLEAVIEAESSCTDNMIELMVIQGQNGRSSIKMPCSMTTCEIR